MHTNELNVFGYFCLRFGYNFYVLASKVVISLSNTILAVSKEIFTLFN
jgi:hypothetical protein